MLRYRPGSIWYRHEVDPFLGIIILLAARSLLCYFESIFHIVPYDSCEE